MINLKKDKVNKIIQLLKNKYPDAKCSLDYKNPLELIIAARLSSQCTDKRVNIVTKKLFEQYKTLQDFASANLNEIETIIKPCGLYHTKAKNIILLSKTLIEKFNGVIPNTIEDLITLPGIGRKTANLVLGEIFKLPSIICDTHCIRITNLLGLTKSKNPQKVELQLKKILPSLDSTLFCHLMVFHGREICKARNPLCTQCTIYHLCDYIYSYLKIKCNNIPL